jgi:hypothetical protein
MHSRYLIETIWLPARKQRFFLESGALTGKNHRMESVNRAGEPSTPLRSPFSEVAGSVATKKRGLSRTFYLIAAVVALLGVGVGGGLWLSRHLSDPLRTLEEFPIAKYLESHRGMAGAEFRGELKVEADLGWKEGEGRLMLFSVGADPRPVAVFIPVGIAQGTYFTKGQKYLAELEVKEGGLIYTGNIRKN